MTRFVEKKSTKIPETVSEINADTKSYGNIAYLSYRSTFASFVFVICDLNLLEGHLARCPVPTSGWRIGVHILQHILTVRLCFPHHNPLGIDVLVAMIVRRIHLQADNVLRLWLQANY